MFTSLVLRIRKLKGFTVYSFFGSILVFSLLCYYYIQSGSSFKSDGLELDYSQPFLYPLQVEDFSNLIETVKTKGIEGTTIQPLNPVFMQTEFLRHPEVVNNLTSHSIGLLVIVKSARENSAKRNLVRKTWGDIDYLREEALLAKDLPTKLLFICGTKNSSDSEEITEDPLQNEMNKHQDIIVGDFSDTYYNTTFKTILSLKWSLLYGQDFQFLALVDDDIYFNIVNLCKYLRNLVYGRVSEVENPNTGFTFLKFNHTRDENSHRISNLSQGLMIGHAKWKDPAIRDSTRDSARKWSISYEDYPYKMYPPYHPGAGIIFDRRAVQDVYLGSLFVKHLRMDDVFLGIIAAKLKMCIVDCPDIHADENHVLPGRVDEIIILHGLEPPQLESVWVTRDFSKTKAS